MDKIKLIKALLLDDNDNDNANVEDKEILTGGSKIKIVILQRGWVVIGKYSEEGENGILNNAYVIRRWGTSEGLGELALNGKQSETKLEKTGVVRFNRLTTVGMIDCDDNKWINKF